MGTLPQTTLRRTRTDWVTLEPLSETVTRATWVTTASGADSWLLPSDWVGEHPSATGILELPRGTLLRPALAPARWEVSVSRLFEAWAGLGDPELAARFPEPDDGRLTMSAREILDVDQPVARTELVFADGSDGSLRDEEGRPLRWTRRLTPAGGVTAAHFDLVVATRQLEQHPWVTRVEVLPVGTVGMGAPAAIDADVLLPEGLWSALVDWAAWAQRVRLDERARRRWVEPNLNDVLVRSLTTEHGGPFGRVCPALGEDPLGLAGALLAAPPMKAA